MDHRPLLNILFFLYIKQNYKEYGQIFKIFETIKYTKGYCPMIYH